MNNWFKVDLGANKSISKIVMYPYECPKRFTGTRLHIVDDACVDVYTGSDINNQGGVSVITVDV